MLKPSQGGMQDENQTARQDDTPKDMNLIQSYNWGRIATIDREMVKNNLQKIQEDIAHYNAKIVAVTKYYGIEAILAGYEAGLRNFGESRALDAITKIESLPDEVKQNSTFHFIGHLQSNKAEKVVRHFDIIESIDSIKIARAVSKVACELNKREKVLLQVNNAGEAQKSGYSKDALRAEIQEIIALPSLDVKGLMNIAPINANEAELAELFKDIREFRDELERSFNITLPELSMGMSNDYKVALKEGATIIRIGRKLFK